MQCNPGRVALQEHLAHHDHQLVDRRHLRYHEFLRPEGAMGLETGLPSPDRLHLSARDLE